MNYKWILVAVGVLLLFILYTKRDKIMGWFFGKKKIKNDDEQEPDSNEQIEENFHVEKDTGEEETEKK